MSRRHRKARHDDFLARAAHAPEDVYHHRENGWAYIPIHPFADETDILERLNLTPGKCTAVDAWWEIGDDAVHMQTRTAQTDDPPGMWIIQGADSKRWTCLIAVLDTPFMTRAVFEDAMSAFFRRLDTRKENAPSS